MTTETVIKSGCKYHDDCFTCPYPTDRLPCEGFKPILVEQARQLRQSGFTTKQIAEKLGRSGRTIGRYLNGN